VAFQLHADRARGLNARISERKWNAGLDIAGGPVRGSGVGPSLCSICPILTPFRQNHGAVMGGQPERTGAFVQQCIELSFLVANSQAVGCSCLQDISTALEKEIVACFISS